MQTSPLFTTKSPIYNQASLFTTRPLPFTTMIMTLFGVVIPHLQPSALFTTRCLVFRTRHPPFITKSPYLQPDIPHLQSSTLCYNQEFPFANKSPIYNQVPYLQPGVPIYNQTSPIYNHDYDPNPNPNPIVL